MALVRSTTSHRHRRHADRPRPWAQFPWTFLGMAFVTALFLASYQTGTAVPSGDVENRAPYDRSAAR